MSRERTRGFIAKALIFTGVLEVLGATGACECGSYSLQEYIFCIMSGTVLVFTGWNNNFSESQ